MNKFIEHTLLKQDATKNELINLLDEAIKYNSAMITSVPQNSDRADFFNLIRSRGFYGVMKYIFIILF